MTTVEVTIRNCREELARVSRLVNELATADRLPPGVVADMHVALDEVVTNIISISATRDEALAAARSA